MTVTFSPAPKPFGRLDADERAKAQVEKILARKKARKPLRRKAWLPRSTKPMAKINVRATTRRRQRYDTHMRSGAWKLVRYERFLLDKGMCQCEWCIEERANDPSGILTNVFADAAPEGVTRMEAHQPIPVYFTAKGSKPHLRIRGFSTHHVRYTSMGAEALRDLRTMYPHHHAATEAKYGTRRRYLAKS